MGQGFDESPRATALPEAEAKITLGLLSAVEANSRVTQRSMARELGIALGLANAYLKRCVRKGLIKVREVPANRYAYYLTPKGFAEKSRLTAEYLAISFNFFRGARAQCGEIFDELSRLGWSRIALVGAGEFAEIATLAAREHGVVLVGIIDPKAGARSFAGLPLYRTVGEAGAFDALVITDVTAPQATYDATCRAVEPKRVRAPRVLGISQTSPAATTRVMKEAAE